jgi:hypothetical protein
MSNLVVDTLTNQDTQLCKAWVNFNGTDTVAIRGSYNVSSITDNGTGDYTVNFTTAMPDVNYVVSLVTSLFTVTNSAVALRIYGTATGGATTKTTTALRICSFSTGGVDVGYDMAELNMSIFR